jgi:hypothetical protein
MFCHHDPKGELSEVHNTRPAALAELLVLQRRASEGMFEGMFDPYL